MTIPALHSLYVELTGMAARYDMSREYVWLEWLRWKHTPADLRLVVAYLKREIKLGKRNPGCLKFSNLIGNADYFEEDKLLALAFDRITQKLAKRPAMAPSAASVSRSAGIQDKAAEVQTKSAEQVLRESAFIKQHLAEWRKANT